MNVREVAHVLRAEVGGEEVEIVIAQKKATYVL
jgi:hypothetical protein